MTNQQGAPEALRPIARYKIGYHTDDWGVRSSTPGGIQDPAGGWVRYEDHLAALQAQQPAPSAAAATEVENLRKALQFYADKDHFNIADEGAWDTVSGEPQNYWCDEEGTATVEDGTIARLALAGRTIKFEDEAQQPAPSAAGAVGEVPLPLLVRDIAADLGTTPIQVCTALAQLGFGGHSVNMAVTPRMAKSLRAHFASTTPQADSAPAEAVQRIIHLRADRERRVYVAGPMTGLPEYNFPLFNATAARLRSEGWHVENPAEHGHVEGAVWADYLRWDISRIATCGAIYLLPGWSKSKGATLEVRIAGELGMQVLLADGAEAPQADSQPAPVLDESTPGEWFVRKLEKNGELVDCFVAAPDYLGFAYDAEILGDDEYRDKPESDETSGIRRKLADCELIVAAVKHYRAARAQAGGVTAPAGGNWVDANDVNRLVRELDVALNGEAGAAAQASLCDVVAQVRHEVAKRGQPLFPTTPAQAADSVLEDADPIRALIAEHAAILDQNESAYFELCYHRATGWMAWITDKPLCMPPVVNPDRKVLAKGQGDTADEACRDAARKQGGGT